MPNLIDTINNAVTNVTSKVPVPTLTPTPQTVNQTIPNQSNYQGSYAQTVGYSQTPVVSSNGTTSQVNNAHEVVNAGGLRQSEADARDAAATPDMKFLPGSGKPNPNYINPVAPTPTPEAPKTPEQILAEEGTKKVYNQNTGQEQTINTGETIPTGYSDQNPLTRKDVSASVDAGGGVTIKQFSDGTYGRFNLGTGDYAQVSSEDFKNAQRVQDAQKASDNAKQGIYSPAQQSQIDATMKLYQDTIDKQIGENTLMAYGINAAQRGVGYLGSANISENFKSGLSNIVTLSANRDKAIADMKAGFEADDVNAVKDAFNIYTQNSQDIQKQIDQNQTMIQNEKTKLDTKNQSYALTAAAKYRDTTEPIDQFDSPAEVDRKVKTSSVYMNEQKTKAGIIDPEAIKGMVESYKVTGVVPSFSGLMGAPQRAAFWAAVGGSTGIIGDANSNRIALKAASSALDNQTKIGKATQTAVDAMEGGLQLAEKWGNQVDRTGSPIVNKYLLWTQGKLGTADDATMTAINNFDAAITTVSQEYAKIMTGAAASIAGTTVSSQADAKAFINKELTQKQFAGVAGILRADAKIRLTAYDSTIKSIKDDISQIGQMGNYTTSSTSGTQTTTPLTANTVW